MKKFSQFITESVEQIDELSTPVLKNYARKAAYDNKKGPTARRKWIGLAHKKIHRNSKV